MSPEKSAKHEIASSATAANFSVAVAILNLPTCTWGLAGYELLDASIDASLAELETRFAGFVTKQSAARRQSGVAFADSLSTEATAERPRS